MPAEFLLSDRPQIDKQVVNTSLSNLFHTQTVQLEMTNDYFNIKMLHHIKKETMFWLFRIHKHFNLLRVECLFLKAGNKMREITGELFAL